MVRPGYSMKNMCPARVNFFMLQAMQVLLLSFVLLSTFTLASHLGDSQDSELMGNQQMSDSVPDFEDATSFLEACSNGNRDVIRLVLEDLSYNAFCIDRLDEGFITAADQGHWAIVLNFLCLSQLSPSIQDNHVFNIALAAENLAVIKAILLHPNFEMDTEDLIARASQARPPQVLEVILRSGVIDALHPDYFGILLAVLVCDHAVVARAALYNPHIMITRKENSGKSNFIIDLLKTRIPSVQSIFLSHPGMDISVFDEPGFQEDESDLDIIRACRMGDYKFVENSFAILLENIILLDLCFRIASDNQDIRLFWTLEPLLHFLSNDLEDYTASYFPYLNAVIPAYTNGQIFATISPFVLLKDVQRLVIRFLWLSCSYQQ